MMSLASCTVAKSGHSCSYLLTFMNFVFAFKCIRGSIVGGALLDHVTTPHRACDE